MSIFGINSKSPNWPFTLAESGALWIYFKSNTKVFRLFNPYLLKCVFDGYIDFRLSGDIIPLVFILAISLKTAIVAEVANSL